MRYVIDHDLHIHTHLSPCDGDLRQTPAYILEHAKKLGLHTMCITDHFWDEKVPGAYKWYQKQTYEHICRAKPLPKDESVRMWFGAETELLGDLTLGISEERMAEMDFFIIPTTHMHMSGVISKEASVEERAAAYVKRFRAVLDMELPFEKIGLAHLTTCLVCVPYDNAHNVLKLVSNEDYYDLFSRSAKIGVGIELNHGDFISQSPELYAESLRAFRIAKEAGCKFYLGSDAHAPAGFKGFIETLEKIISDLDLTEDDKLDIVRR